MPRSVRTLLLVFCIGAGAIYCLGPLVWLCLGRQKTTHRVTFDVADDGRTVYFTDWDGKAASIDLETKQVSEITLCSEPVSAIRISQDGKRLAFSTEPSGRRKHPEVVFAQKNAQGAWAIEHRFPGKYPCFSQDGESIYYCRSARSVYAGGFNGVLWSETTLWSFDLQTKKETEINSESFHEIDDVEHDASRSRLIFSATRSDPNASSLSNLFELDLKTRKIKQLTHCPKDCTCGADPAISQDGETLAYISDQDDRFRYKVILENLKDQSRSVFGPKAITYLYFSQPRFVGDECYVLNTESYTLNTQARFRLIAFDREGKWRVLIGQELLSP